MNRKIRITVLSILCIVLMGATVLFGMNGFSAEATERTVVESGTSGKISWTLYDDGELYVSGSGSLSGALGKSCYSSVKKSQLQKRLRQAVISIFI